MNYRTKRKKVQKLILEKHREFQRLQINLHVRKIISSLKNSSKGHIRTRKLEFESSYPRRRSRSLRNIEKTDYVIDI